LRPALRSFDVPNYRRYFFGQLVSLSGTWMQTVAEMWLVLQLTHSGVAVGAAAALQFAPMLLGGAWGGLIADRLPKRRLLIATQTAMALPALALLTLTVTGAIELWMLYLLIFARGAVNAIDNPARQAFLVELVGPERLVNAVSLGSALINGARTIGPALAGVLIATAGVEPCFALNALSFAAMIAALHGMDRSALRRAPRAPRSRGLLCYYRMSSHSFGASAPPDEHVTLDLQQFIACRIKEPRNPLKEKLTSESDPRPTFRSVLSVWMPW